MAQHLKNNTEEMEKLFKEHYPLLCLISFGIVKNKEAAKDVVQDFFISYWQRSKSDSIKTSFKAYAIGAVKNLSLLSLQKKGKEKLLLQDLDIESYREPAVLELKSSKGKVQDLLKKLPEARRRIFISAIINEQSYAEIAENQGISINTVKTQMKRAYASLRTETTKNILRVIIWFTLVFVK